jgi:PEP-CTERM motif
MKRVFTAIVAMVVSGAPAGAAIVSGKLTIPAAAAGFSAARAALPVPSDGSFLRVDSIPSGLVVGLDNFNDANVRGFDERQNVRLDRRLFLDGGRSIAAGTRIASHHLVFDPATLMSATGSVVFSGQVLGLGTSRGVLARTDFLGVPGVAYQNPTSRGIEEVSDWANFDGKTVNFHFVTSTPGDSIRVFTAAAAVPEPSSWALLLTGFGLVGHSLRRSRRRVAQGAG